MYHAASESHCCEVAGTCEGSVLLLDRLPVSFGMLLTGETLIPSWGPEGKLLRLCLCLSCFLPARSDDKFTAHSGVVRSAHCWTWGDLAFYAGIAQLQ